MKDDDRNFDRISAMKDGGADGFLWIVLLIHSLIHLDADLDRYETDSVVISLHDSDEEAHCWKWPLGTASRHLLIEWIHGVVLPMGHL